MLSSKEEKIQRSFSEKDAKLCPFDNSVEKQTQFFTTYSPELAFGDLLEVINDIDGLCEVKMDGSNYKV